MSGGMEIYVEGSPGERRSGHLDAQGEVVAFDVGRPTRPRWAGAVVLARVRSVDPRLGAAFLNLGPAGEALLNRAKDIAEGETVLVQVARDGHDDKGPAATRQIVLWGRYTALQPGRGGGLQTVRALGQGRRRAETVAAAEAVLEDSGDLLLRAPAAAVDGETIAGEAAALRAVWADLRAKTRTAKAPAVLLDVPDFIDLTLREAGPGARVALDDRLDFAAAQDLAKKRYPDLLAGLAFHDGKTPIFDAAGLSDALEDALSPEVPLAGGGRLTVEETRALTAIDVDLGAGEAGAAAKPEALRRLNRWAAEAVARQIVLRRLSGLIAVDFAGIAGRSGMKPLLDILRSRLKGFEGQADVLGVTTAGLVEITRRRAGPSLAELFLGRAAARRAAPDAEAAEILRRALRLSGAGKPVADLSEAAAKQLSGPMKQALQETERRLGQDLILRPGAARPDVRMEK